MFLSVNGTAQSYGTAQDLPSRYITFTDWRTEVHALGPAGKLGAEDAARLDAEAAHAVSCIGSLGT
jgi:hypothetical protein